MSTPIPKELPPYIEGLRDQALKAGNNTGGQYIACICGMWAHVLGVKGEVFSRSDADLQGWYVVGYTASMQCVAMRQRTK
jgi:hypothetical protein